MSIRSLTEGSRQRVARMAPQHPPCFGSQAAWVEWLGWALEADDQTVQVLVRERADGVPTKKARVFNRDINFCADCVRNQVRTRMEQSGRCRPDWLRNFEDIEAAAAALEVAPC